MYQYATLIQGFNGSSSDHGMLGWSTVMLLSAGKQHVLIDTGAYHARLLLLEKLKERGLKREDITTILLTHSHWDHCMNWPMFPNAEIVIGRKELEWALHTPALESFAPEFVIHELARSDRLRVIGENEEVLPQITSHGVPGHTPGQIAFLIDQGQYDIVFASDAVKNRIEWLTQSFDWTLDPEASKQSLQTLRQLWTRKQGSLLVPGHDAVMALEGEKTVYHEQRNAGITFFYGETRNEAARISLL